MRGEAIGSLVELRDTGGKLVAVGRCIAYVESPTVTIETLEGTRVHWRADMGKTIGGVDVANALFGDPPEGGLNIGNAYSSH